jgi:guanosine-3',5'-bis(diphosphate) 3'-pyrophosphohydrolase
MLTKNALIEASIRVASMAHEGQKDLIEEPYVMHPIRVMNNVYKMLGGEFRTNFATYALATAALHDVVEDTGITQEQLFDFGFPREVVDAVMLLTRPRTKHDYYEYVRKIKASGNRIAIVVKLADLEDNLDPIRGNTIRVRDPKKYAERQEKYKKAREMLR